VEYYSGIDSTKQSDFLFRLQGLFSNKHLFHLYDEKEANVVKKNNIKRKTKYNMEVSLRNLESNKESAASMLSTMEIKFNTSLTKLNNEMQEQQKSMINTKNRKKREMDLLAEVVSSLFSNFFYIFSFYYRKLHLKQENLYNLLQTKQDYL